MMIEELWRYRVLCVLCCGRHSLVIDHLDELGKVPRVPLSYPHDKGVDVLVEGVEEGNSLDDHVVDLVHIELHLGTRVGVGET